jgi:hypothetical protein
VQEILKQMKEKRESAYRVYREAELTEDAKGLAHMEGILDGMYEMIKLVEEHIK